MQANVDKKVRGLPIHLGTVGVGAIVLFLPLRLVWVLGHGVCTTGTVGAGACHTPKVSWVSLLGTNGHSKEVTSDGRPWWVPTTTRPRGNNVQSVEGVEAAVGSWEKLLRRAEKGGERHEGDKGESEWRT